MTVGFSVIVPTHNRPAALRACLAALDSLDYPRDCVEVIVVDDGGASVPPGLLMRPDGALEVRVLTQPRQGPGAARNQGAQAARFPHLAFTDDDCLPMAGWLRALAARVAVAPEAAVGGQTVNALPTNVYATASEMLVNYLYEYGQRPTARTRFFTTNNLALPAALFHAIGGFDPRFTRAAAEDRDLCDRWQAAGYPLVYAPEAVVCHAHVLTLRGFWQQHVNYGYGAFQYHRLRAARGGGRVQMEPPCFYLDLVRFPWRHKLRRAALRLTLLMALSQVANGVGYLTAFRQACCASSSSITSR